ncbi:MAG: glycosyltransferase family 4 protein [Gemmatales bacterium]
MYPDQKRVSNYRLFWDIRRKIRELKIDVVAINGWYGLFAWWLVLLKRWIGCRIIVLSDTVSWKQARTSMKEFPKKMLLRGIDAGFVAGTPQADYLQSLGMSRSRMTFGIDVVDNQLYSDIPLRSSPSNRKIVIGTAARLIPEKNLKAAIVAFDEVRRNHPELTLEWRIAGLGPLEAELKQTVHDLQVPVVFAGFVGYDDMPGFYRQLDVYWQPSISESWGLVINEAMASGLPVMVSDRCGAAQDLVTDANGWIHDTSQQGMVESWNNALTDRDQWPKLGAASRELINKWGIPRFADGLLHASHIAVDGTH